MILEDRINVTVRQTLCCGDRGYDPFPNAVEAFPVVREPNASLVILKDGRECNFMVSTIQRQGE
jgi:hypothetical protein